MRSSLSFSPSSIFDTGMPVHLETTSAISSSVTWLRTSCGPSAARRDAPRRALLKLRDAAVLQLRHAPEIAGAPRGLELDAHALEFLADVRRALQRGLLGLPDLLEIRVFPLERVQRSLERSQALARGLVILLLERLLLDLQLNDAALEPIERLGLGVDLHADARRGLIDQVDRLVRQLAVGDVAVRERRRGDDGRIGDLDAVMHLVALLQAAQDRDRVLHRGLIDQHVLEAPLERRILLDVLAVLIERRRARRSAARRARARA